MDLLFHLPKPLARSVDYPASGFDMNQTYRLKTRLDS